MANYRLEIKWGLIFFAVALAWMYVEKFMGWHGEKIDQHATMTNIFAVIAILLYVLALRDKRNQLGGTMTWKQGFVAGLIVSVVVAVLSPLSQYIVHNIITPEYFPNIIAYSVESGKMTQEAAEKYFSLSSYMWQSALFALVIGVATSAVVAIFMKKS